MFWLCQQRKRTHLIITRQINMKKKDKVREHQLYLADNRIWRKLRDENVTDPIYTSKKRKINAITLISRPLFLLQRFLFEKKIRAIDINKNPPLFILGHWRSGTTHLHYALNKDPYYASLSNYQLLMFNIVLLAKTRLRPLISPFIPKKRPQDNVKYDLNLPGEEEQALCVMSDCSGLHSWVFPKNMSYFNRYNIFKNTPPEDKARWQKDYYFCIQNISYFNNEKPLLLKNPHNTGRVKELLELFPEAKFIFIHRNPYDIYASTKHFYLRLVNTQFLQHISMQEIDDLIFYFFTASMKKYINERALIPTENRIELSFDDLEKDEIQAIQKIYSTLKISDWLKAKPYIQSYFDSVDTYEKNQFKPLSAEVVQRINQEWAFAFTEWNYQMLEPSALQEASM